MKSCLITLLLLCHYGLLAQTLPSRTLSLPQGLPEYFVSGIVQDNVGFVWVATRNGLARFDGRRFKLFRHLPHNSHSLANNVILSLQTVSDTALLIHLETNAFQLFNPLTETFSDLLTKQRMDQQHIQIAKVQMSSDNREFWGRKERWLFHYLPRQQQLTRMALPRLPLPEDAYPGNTLCFDSLRKQLYAPFPGGIVELITKTRHFSQWRYPALGRQAAIETYYGIPIEWRRNGELLTSSPGQLVIFNPQTHRFRAIPIPSTLATNVGLFHTAADGNTYFTYGMNVYRLSPDDRITLLWTAPRIDYQNYFQALLLDRSGVLWVGTNGDGVQQLDLHALPIQTAPYRIEFLGDVLSAELAGVVPAWAHADHTFYRFRWQAPYLSGWLNGAFRLWRADGSTRSLKQLLTIVPHTNVHREGNGLRRTAGGDLWLYQPDTGLLRVDGAGRLKDRFPLLLNGVSDIQPLGSRIWLATELDGLYAYDPQRRGIVAHLRYQASQPTSLLSDQIGCLAADPQDSTRLWIGTQEGLSRLDTRTLRCRNWTQQQGLPSATINTLLTDHQDQLWFSTLKGISRLNPKTGRMRHYTTEDGLLDIEYRPHDGLALADGRLAFGGVNGLTTFNPQALDEHTYEVPTALTGLKIGHAYVEPRPAGSPLAVPLNATSTLRLKHDQNFLSFEFAGLQYNNPTRLQYRYQLEGVDPDWVYAGEQPVANYTQLAPGRYAFRVNAADALGHWSRQVKRIQVVISPPWWRTGWAYGLYALVFLGLIRAYIRFRLQRERLQLAVALNQQKAQQLQTVDELKTRFFANITHEFRTPLTLILGPLERLKEVLAGPEHRWLDTIERNAQALLGLINQLLDLSKLDSGLLPVHLTRGSLAQTVASLLEAFEQESKDRSIRLELVNELPTDEYWFDADKLVRIGTNLVANALNWTPPAGTVAISLSPYSPLDAEPGEVQFSQLSAKAGIYLTVSDTGVGIPAPHLPFVFNRFYQVGPRSVGDTARRPPSVGDPTVGRDAFRGGAAQLPLAEDSPSPLIDRAATGQIDGPPSPDESASTGSGIGLALVKELVELQGGWVQAQSRQSELLPWTTRFIVWLPYQPAQQTPAVPTSEWMNQSSPKPLPHGLDEESKATTVLIVEDNPELAHFIAQSLPPTYRISQAGNGQEGLEMAIDQGPDLIISDVMMPLMDGFALCQRLKSDPSTSHIPLILLTAKAAHQSRLQGLSVGADDYLTKPFHLEELRLRVHNLLLGRQRLRAWVRQSLTQVSEPATPLPVQDPFLTHLYAVLDQEIHRSSFTVDQLADVLAVSSRSLHRKLASLTGMTANELMRSYRLRQAAQLLQTGESVSVAAYQVGFETLSYFSKCFKEQFGQSPSEFAASHRSA